MVIIYGMIVAYMVSVFLALSVLKVLIGGAWRAGVH